MAPVTSAHVTADVDKCTHGMRTVIFFADPGHVFPSHILGPDPGSRLSGRREPVSIDQRGAAGGTPLSMTWELALVKRAGVCLCGENAAY